MLRYTMMIEYKVDKSKVTPNLIDGNGDFKCEEMLVVRASLLALADDIFLRSDRTFVFETISHKSPKAHEEIGTIAIRALARPRFLRPTLFDEFVDYGTEMFKSLRFPDCVCDVAIVGVTRSKSLVKYIRDENSGPAFESLGGRATTLQAMVADFVSRPNITYGSIFRDEFGKDPKFAIDTHTAAVLRVEHHIVAIEQILDKSSKEQSGPFPIVPIGFIVDCPHDMSGNYTSYTLPIQLQQMMYDKGLIVTGDFISYKIDESVSIIPDALQSSIMFSGWFIVLRLVGDVKYDVLRDVYQFINGVNPKDICIFIDMSDLSPRSKIGFETLMAKGRSMSRNWYKIKNDKLEPKDCRTYLNKRAKEMYNGKFPKRITWPKIEEAKTFYQLDDIFDATIRCLQYKLGGYDKIDGILVPRKLRRKKDKKEEKCIESDAMAKLNSLIGLEPMKKKVDQIVKYHRMCKQYQEAGMTISSPSFNMVFYGNPGTAKTTCARLIAEIFSNEGIVKANRFKELSRKDLCAGFVGQTALKTEKVLKSATGGVIFIDEAYSLSYADAKNDYGTEVINELVAAMEASAKDTVFIFAGYKKEMEDFMKTNPGLSSRVPNVIEFPNYTLKELMEILISKFGAQGFVLDKHAKKIFETMISHDMTKHDFGNGRYVRTIVEQAIFEHSTRLYGEDNITPEALKTITAADLPNIKSIPSKQKPIGFGNKDK